MNFTYKNHLKYYIDNKLYGFRENGHEKFSVSIGSVDREYFQKSSFQNELRRTADYVYSDYGKDFALFLSGGTDSEIVARNFLSIGVKPSCFVIRLIGGYNESDVCEAIDLAKNLGLKIQVLDFDVLEYFNSGAANEFGAKIQCTQITYLMVYQNILKLGMPSVMGGELLLKRNVSSDPSSWYYCFRENEDASAIRFSNTYNIPLVNEWFSYTPELMLFYLQHSDVINLVKTRLNYKLSSVSSKNTFLKTLLPEIRVRKKTHGFEELLGFNFEVYRHLTSNQILRLTDCIDGIEYENAKKILIG